MTVVIKEHELLIFFAGTADFTVTTQQIQMFEGQQQQAVTFTLVPDTTAQEPNETFQIVATIVQARPLQPNEFIQGTKRVIIIDITSKMQ